jgi:hypothetical protein
MNRFNIQSITTEKATVDLIDTKDGVKILFTGEIDVQNPEPVFLPYFYEIHDKMLENKVMLVELDFINLSFMNSGGIKTLIKWVTKMLNLPDNQKYKFRIIANSSIAWQEASLQMLSRLSPKFIEIETE